MLTINKTKNPIAILNEGKNKGTLIYYDDKKPKISNLLLNKVDSQLITERGSFFPIPSTVADRDAIYIVGKSGCGKSSWAANYVKIYHQMYPDNGIYLLTNKDKDPVFDVLKYIKRIPIDKYLIPPEEGEEADEDDQGVIYEDFENSLVIFDDVDSFSDKILEKAILKLQNDIYMLGRSKHISILHLKHIGRDHAKSKIALQEMTGIVLFPGISNPYATKKILEVYVDLDKHKISEILKLKSSSRWIYISVNHPSYLISEKKISLL